MKRPWIHTLMLVLLSSVHASEPCPQIEGIESVLLPGRILLLGEIHGTLESPTFALDVACHAARAELPVVLGLELPPAEQARVEAFLGSGGNDDDRDALLGGAFWRSGYQDGRASRAMLELLEGARLMSRAGLPVRVALFDASGRSGGQQRERDMARNLALVATDATNAMMIVLTGNRHSRITTGSPRNARYEPMGYLLGRATSAERIIALNAAHGGGSAWVCAPDCGIIDLSGHHSEGRWKVEIDEATRPSGHHGWYHIGGITASPPATLSFAAPPPASPAVAVAVPAPTASAGTAAKAVPSAADSRFSGGWQAYDFGSSFETWRFRFDEDRFHAIAGEDDWYEGRIAFRPDADPAQIDFAIEDCLCSYKGMTSEAIYYWDDDSIVISAPRPGSPRPRRFVEQSGQMMQLRKLDED